MANTTRPLLRLAAAAAFIGTGIVATAVSFSEPDQAFDNTITGQLVDIEGNTISDRSIILTREGEGIPITGFNLNKNAASTTPDAKGHFQFSNLQGGCYDIHVGVDLGRGISLGGFNEPKTVCIEARKEIIKPILGPVTVDMGPVR